MSISKDHRGDLVIGNAHIFGRNFAGNRFGKGGGKGFCVNIESPEWAQALSEEGWNIKFSQPRDPDEPPRAFMPVAINYNERFNPNIYMYTGKNRVRMTDTTVGSLDNADLEKVNLIIHGRVRTDEQTGDVHIKAFVKTGHFTLEEDPFADEYAEYDRNVMSEDTDNADVPFDV